MPDRILIINQNTGYLTIDIANALSVKYSEVTIIAGIVKPLERVLKESVKVRKTIKLNRQNLIMKGLSWSFATIQIFFLLLFKYRHHKVLYFTNPPMAYLLSLLLKNNFSLVVYDIYPDALKNIGINEKNIVYRWWGKWNKKLFKKADKIIALSNGMADQLSAYVEHEKIRVIANWSGSEKFAPVKKEENSFIKNHQLEGKFIVLYSGNMGLTHNVETLIEVAKVLESKVHIRFLFVGEGEKKEKLQKQSRQYNLTNCMFLTWQSTNVFPYSLASADISVITINEESAHLSVPSKTYNLLAVGSPLLCIAPKSSELALLIEKYNNGRCFENKNIDEIAQFIITVSENEAMKNAYAKNSLKAAKDFHYSNALKYL